MITNNRYTYILYLCFSEYANNLQGQKRPERIENDSLFIVEYANNFQGQKRPGRIWDDSFGMWT